MNPRGREWEDRAGGGGVMFRWGEGEGGVVAGGQDTAGRYAMLAR